MSTCAQRSIPKEPLRNLSFVLARSDQKPTRRAPASAAAAITAKPAKLACETPSATAPLLKDEPAAVLLDWVPEAVLEPEEDAEVADALTVEPKPEEEAEFEPVSLRSNASFLIRKRR